MLYLCKMIISPGVFFIFSKFWGQKTVQNDKKFSVTLHISRTIYTSYDCHLWCKCVKWYLQVFFSILKFLFSGLSGGWKGKKWPKMTKISVCRTLYFRNHISYDLHLCYTCMYKRIIISPGIFSIFSKF